MERGYTRVWHEAPGAIRGCVCPEDFEHDGKCQNALRGKKEAKCQPCSQGWHFDFPCERYVTKSMTIHVTQCNRCGWDSAEHVSIDAT